MIRSKNHFYERKIGHKKVDNALETCIFPACDFIWGQFCSLNSCWGFCPSLQIRLCFLKGYPLLEYPVKNKKSSDNALLLTVYFADCCVGTLHSVAPLWLHFKYGQRFSDYCVYTVWFSKPFILKKESSRSSCTQHRVIFLQLTFLQRLFRRPNQAHIFTKARCAPGCFSILNFSNFNDYLRSRKRVVIIVVNIAYINIIVIAIFYFRKTCK